MKRVITMGLVIGFAVVSRQAFADADEMPARGPIQFSTYDQDGNETVSMEEFNPARATRMSARAAEGKPLRGAGNTELDSDGNGTVKREEFAAHQAEHHASRHGAGYRED